MKMFDFFKFRKPKAVSIPVIKPYYMKYDGRKGYAMAIGRVTERQVAIAVNARGGGRINRIMKVTNRKFFSDFGGCCTSFDIKRTERVLN